MFIWFLCSLLRLLHTFFITLVTFHNVFNWKGDVCGAEEKNIKSGLVVRILNMYSLKSLTSHQQETPDTGHPVGTLPPQEDAVSVQQFNSVTLPKPRSALASPDWARNFCSNLACPLFPKTLQYLCKRGRALCQHCHSLGDHQAFHTHFTRVEVNRANCMSCFALSCQIFPDTIYPLKTIA